MAFVPLGVGGRVLLATDLPGYEVGVSADAADGRAVSDFEACAGTAATLGQGGQSAVSPGFFFRGRTVVVSSLSVVAHDQARRGRRCRPTGT